jgi:hypothetical protein
MQKIRELWFPVVLLTAWLAVAVYTLFRLGSLPRPPEVPAAPNPPLIVTSVTAGHRAS